MKAKNLLNSENTEYCQKCKERLGEYLLLPCKHILCEECCAKAKDCIICEREFLKKTKSYTCELGHELIFSPKGDQEIVGEFICNACSKTYKYSEIGHFACKICKIYKICSECRKPPRDPLFFCLKNHPLIYNNCILPGEDMTFSCSICKNIDRSMKNGRWSCNICNYNICHNCRPPKIPEDKNMISTPSFLRCPKDHALIWSTLENCGVEFYCQKCKQNNLKSSKGRWQCEECKYNICPKCMPQPRHQSIKENE